MPRNGYSRFSRLTATGSGSSEAPPHPLSGGTRARADRDPPLSQQGYTLGVRVQRPRSALDLKEALLARGRRRRDHREDPWQHPGRQAPAPRPLLLLDGEQLVGAKQNRILNMTVLVAAQSEVTIRSRSGREVSFDPHVQCLVVNL